MSQTLPLGSADEMSGDEVIISPQFPTPTLAQSACVSSSITPVTNVAVTNVAIEEISSLKFCVPSVKNIFLTVTPQKLI